MGFAQDWKSAKTVFETATNKKKPSAKFMGVFHKAGLEDVTKALDTVLAKGDLKGLEKALLDYARAASAYQGTLEKSAKAEGQANIAAELKKLGDALDDISHRAGLAVNERAKVLQRDAADALAKEAREVAEKGRLQVDKLLGIVYADLKILEQASASADTALRQVLEHQGKGNAKEAKKAAATVHAAAKTAEGQARKVTAANDKAEKLFTESKAGVAKLKLDLRQFGGKNPAQPVFDATDSMVMKLAELVEQAAADVVEVQEAAVKADHALIGALDLRATYLASCRKLEKRAQDAAVKYDAVARDVGGQADRAQQEQMTAAETDDPTGRATAVKQSTFYIVQVRKQAAQGKKEIVAVAGELKETRKSLPADVNDKDKDYGPPLAKCKEWLESLKESHDALMKAESKVEKAEKTLKTLG